MYRFLSAVFSTCICFSLCVMVLGQKSNTVSAILTYKDYLKAKRKKKDNADKLLQDAYSYISISLTNEATKNDPKTLYNAWKIYLEIYKKEKNRYLLDSAITFAQKTFQEDKKQKYTSDLIKEITNYKNAKFNKAIGYYENNEFAKSFENFYLSSILSEALNIRDSASYFNGALAAYNANMLDEAVLFFDKCTEIHYKGNLAYHYIFDIYQKQDKQDAIPQLLDSARQKYPKDFTLIIDEINYYLLVANDLEKVEEKLLEAISIDSNNLDLYINGAYVYIKLSKLSKAISMYNKALEIDSANVDVLTSLGDLYFNQAAEINNKANLEEDDTKYNQYIDDSKKLFRQALPYYEKSITIKKDKQIVKSLLLIYSKLEMVDKYKTLKTEL